MEEKQKFLDVLDVYNDKAFVYSVLCIQASRYYNILKYTFQMPIIITSSVLSILNGSTGDENIDKHMKIINTVFNITTALILSVNNVFKFEGLNELNKIIKSYKLKNTFVYKRYFPNKVKNLNIRKIKLCHIDVNTYVSTKKCFYYVKNKIVKNGIIIFDDYGIHGVEKVTNFINKLIKKEKRNFIFIQNYFGQCLLLKK